MSEWIDTVYRPPRAKRPWRLHVLLGQKVRYFSLGRWALVEALKTCGVKPGDRVLMPGLICRVVVSSLREAGAIPVFYPVDAKMNLSAPPSSLPRSAAIIAVNYFGFPQDMAPFKKYAAITGARIIEDNTHGLFSRAANGAWLGTRADAGIFSLHKTMAVPSAGALVSRLPMPAPLDFRDDGDAHWLAKDDFRQHTKGLGPIGTREFINELSRRLPNKPDPFLRHIETRIAPSPNPGIELSMGISAADPNRELQRRRKLYELCQVKLNLPGIRPVFAKVPRLTAPFGFPFYSSSSALPYARRALAKLGLESKPWPDLPADIRPTAPAHYNNIHIVSFLW